MAANEADFLVVGAGIAGASAACFLAERGRVALLEREPQPGYHSTGRSAAVYEPGYGPAAIRAITAASRPFFLDPPAGFAEHPLLLPRGVMILGPAGRADAVERMVEETRRLVPSMRMIAPAEAEAMVPVLRPGYTAAAAVQSDAMDIDVHAVHQGFLRGLRARGGSIRTDAEVRGIARRGDMWEVETGAGAFRAPILVNAAGAWCDVLARMAGVPPLGLVPKRRTAFIFAPPAGIDASRWPLVLDVDETFYFKPDAGKLLGSPADETPVEPCDVQPEELDIAVAADRIQTATTLEIRRIERRWAGLRSFFSDKTPAVGFDPAADGFFWLAGQGGYGIQTAPAMGRLVAALAAGEPVPADLADLGLGEAQISPARLRRGA